MNRRRMGAWACAVVVGFCAVCGRAEEVVGVRELTADTVLTRDFLAEIYEMDVVAYMQEALGRWAGIS